MSKSYFMLQIVYPPQAMPNPELEEITAQEADKYIKAGKMTKASVLDYLRVQSPTFVPHADYRRAAICTRVPLTFNEDGTGKTFGFDPEKNQVFYRIVLDQETADEFGAFCYQHGAIGVRVITEEDRGVLDGVPETLFDFPDDTVVAQHMWTA